MKDLDKGLGKGLDKDLKQNELGLYPLAHPITPWCLDLLNEIPEVGEHDCKENFVAINIREKSKYFGHAYSINGFDNGLLQCNRLESGAEVRMRPESVAVIPSTAYASLLAEGDLAYGNSTRYGITTYDCVVEIKGDVENGFSQCKVVKHPEMLEAGRSYHLQTSYLTPLVIQNPLGNKVIREVLGLGAQELPQWNLGRGEDHFAPLFAERVAPEPAPQQDPFAEIPPEYVPEMKVKNTAKAVDPHEHIGKRCVIRPESKWFNTSPLNPECEGTVVEVSKTAVLGYKVQWDNTHNNVYCVEDLTFI